MIGETASEAARAYASLAKPFFSVGPWLLILELGRASVFAASKTYLRQLKVEAEPPRNRFATEEFQVSDRLPTRSKLEMGND